MAAGGPGDHPLSDICHWQLPVYSDKVDALIREISKLMAMPKLYELYNWFSPPQIEIFEKELENKLHELQEQAKLNGWELH